MIKSIRKIFGFLYLLAWYIFAWCLNMTDDKAVWNWYQHARKRQNHFILLFLYCDSVQNNWDEPGAANIDLGYSLMQAARKDDISWLARYEIVRSNLRFTNLINTYVEYNATSFANYALAYDDMQSILGKKDDQRKNHASEFIAYARRSREAYRDTKADIRCLDSKNQALNAFTNDTIEHGLLTPQDWRDIHRKNIGIEVALGSFSGFFSSVKKAGGFETITTDTLVNIVKEALKNIYEQSGTLKAKNNILFCDYLLYTVIDKSPSSAAEFPDDTIKTIIRFDSLPRTNAYVQRAVQSSRFAALTL